MHSEAPYKVIHRDLKSKNVVISDDYTLKLCDFGASRFLTHSATMTLVGTFPWMAPEVIQGLKSNESCDIYSLGVLLWEMLTREVPFKGMEGFQVAWMVVEKRQRPPIPETAPLPLRNLISQCWQHDFKKRPTVSEIIDIMTALADDDALRDETTSFMKSKDEWENEYEDALDSLKTEQHSSVKEREDAVSERERKVREWEERQREEAKNHVFFGVAQIEEQKYSQKIKFSGTGEGAGESVRAMLESVSGYALPNASQAQAIAGGPIGALTRGSSGTSLTGTPTDDEPGWQKYGSNHSLSSISSAPGSTTIKNQKYFKKRSVGTPPHSPLTHFDGQFFRSVFSFLH